MSRRKKTRDFCPIAIYVGDEPRPMTDGEDVRYFARFCTSPKGHSGDHSFFLDSDASNTVITRMLRERAQVNGLVDELRHSVGEMSQAMSDVMAILDRCRCTR